MDLPWMKEKGYSVRGCHFLSLRQYITHFYQLEKSAASLTLPNLKGHTHGGKMVGKKISMGEDDFSEDH